MLKSLCLLFTLCLTFATAGYTSSLKLDFSPGKINDPILLATKIRNPDNIAFYAQHSSIKRPYRIIGKSSVPRRNIIGFTRQAKTINEIMRKKAATMGGDAIINIKQDSNNVEGVVIAFEKALS